MMPHGVPKGLGDPRDAARGQWEMSNCVVTDDAFSRPNTDHMDELHKTQPWKSSPHYFQSVKVSVLAALQMMIHAKRGSPNVACDSSSSTSGSGTASPPDKSRRENWFEVMGLLLGHFNGREMIVTGAFGLPVDASEVECSMNDASQLYMLDFLQYHQRGGTQEGCIGWYHSHPGYTCFLSGTDVNTQQLGQSAQDPWLAIVVDPVRTISSGRLDMKAFRTFPEAYAAEQLQEAQQRRSHTVAGRRSERSAASATSSIPASRVREYGVHAHRYYELPITLVRSKNDEAQLDRLWCRYWTLTFSMNPLAANRSLTTQHMHQLANVLESGVAGRIGKETESSRVYSATSRQSWQQQRQQSQQMEAEEDTLDDAEAFQQRSIQMRYLASALASEVALASTLTAVKNAAFQA